MEPRLSYQIKKRYPEYITEIRNRAIALQEAGHHVLRLESGDIEVQSPPEIVAAITQAMQEGKTKYAHQCGIAPLRKKIQQEIQETRDVPLSLDDICVTNGGTGALFTSFFMTLNERDEAIVPAPYWSVIASQIRHLRAELIEVPLTPTFDLDHEAIIKNLTSRTRAIYINTPNNPTGALFSRQALEDVAEIAVSRNLWVVSDEAYDKIIFEGHHYSIFSMIPERTLLCGSFSKSLQSTGLRVGYVATANKEISSRFGDVARSMTSGISTPTQYGLAQAQVSESSLQSFLQTLQRKRDILVKGLSQVRGMYFQVPKAGLFIFVDCSEHIPPEVTGKERELYLANRLLDEGIAVCPGAAFGRNYSSYIRLAFSTPTEQQLVETGQRLQQIFGTKS